jgi:hypothetical protein
MTVEHGDDTFDDMDGPLTGGTYEIVIGAVLAHDWSEWFDGFEVEAKGQATLLRGKVADQSELHGVFGQLRDLGIPILEVHRLQDPPSDS